MKFPDGAFADYSLEEELDVMVAAGMAEPMETMIVNCPYLMFVMERRAHEVFVLLRKCFFDEFKLILLP